MQPEVRSCQSCKMDFRIEPEDFDFYAKIKVPPPTFCPPCRDIRRSAWREERTLYRDTCRLCGKSTLSTHVPDGPFTIYCRDCWISDKWDPLDYGRDYDFTKPFFLQYRELMEAVPRPALTGTNLQNCEYSHACLDCKNCYLAFWAFKTENSQYAFGPLLSKGVFDIYTVDNSEDVYEAIHSNRLYRTSFAYFADDCLDSSFLFDCLGISDSFGCVNLRKKKYCLWNEQLSREEYREKIKYWDLGSYAKLEEAKARFRELYLSVPHRFAHVLSSQNVTGDIIRDTKDCQTCFSSLDGVQNCKYLYFGGAGLKDSYDISRAGLLSNLLYEVVALTRSSECFFSAGGENSKNVYYSDWPKNCSDVFGCINLRHKKYCILNKQYSKEEYEYILPRIIKHMEEMPYVDQKGRIYKYGEFFPAELSAYPYNHSSAFTWYPKTKEGVLAEGWRWHGSPERAYEITTEPRDIPDHIKDVPDAIMAEVIGCQHKEMCNEQCTQAFRITPEELAFYRKMNLALPRLCPNCRYAGRLRWRNGFTLHRRECACAQSGHPHPGKCRKIFETTFPPEAAEIVYCAECYKSEYLA